MTWTPISLEDMTLKIHEGERGLNGDLLRFWQSIKVAPKRWTEKTHGQGENGFWVVAMSEKKIIWYNDIEEGFNISNYITRGEIEDYTGNQDKLITVIKKLFELPATT